MDVVRHRFDVGGLKHAIHLEPAKNLRRRVSIASRRANLDCARRRPKVHDTVLDVAYLSRIAVGYILRRCWRALATIDVHCSSSLDGVAADAAFQTQGATECVTICGLAKNLGRAGIASRCLALDSERYLRV